MNDKNKRTKINKDVNDMEFEERVFYRTTNKLEENKEAKIESFQNKNSKSYKGLRKRFGDFINKHYKNELKCQAHVTLPHGVDPEKLKALFKHKTNIDASISQIASMLMMSLQSDLENEPREYGSNQLAPINTSKSMCLKHDIFFNLTTYEMEELERFKKSEKNKYKYQLKLLNDVGHARNLNNKAREEFMNAPPGEITEPEHEDYANCYPSFLDETENEDDFAEIITRNNQMSSKTGKYAALKGVFDKNDVE